MQEDHVLVTGQVDVALHTVGAVGDGLQVSRTGVLGERGTGTPVGVDLRAERGEVVASHADTVAHTAVPTGATLG